MRLERFLGIAGLVLGIVAIAIGSSLTTQGTLSFFQPTSASQSLLSLNGQNLHDGGDRTFLVPLVARPSASLTIRLQSSGPVDLAVFNNNGPLATTMTGQSNYTLTLAPTYDTIASIQITNNGVSPVTFNLSVTESYTNLTPQTSQVYQNAGYLGLATGVGLLVLGLALILEKEKQAPAHTA